MFNIKELRLKKGVGQSEVAKYVGVSLRTIQHWEKGSKNITIDKLDKINSFFGLNTHYDSFENYHPESLVVSEPNPEYILNKENIDKIILLEQTIILKDEQLNFYKEQIQFLKQKNKKV